MKKYDKQLHDRLRHRTGLYCYNDHIGVDSDDIDALLDEIERLRSENSRIPGLQQSNNELCIEIQQANAWIKRLQSDIKWVPMSWEEPFGGAKCPCELLVDNESKVTHWRSLPKSLEEE